MEKIIRSAVGLGTLLIVAALNPAPASAASCSSLATLTLAHTSITVAEEVAAGEFKMPADPVLPPGEAQARQRFAEAFKDLPEFCRVTATIRPVADSEIKIEVWMPPSGWNGKFLAVGNGGWAGTINYSGMNQSLRRGYATASTDTGHAGSGGDASFAYGHPEKLVDLGYRSVHLMTVDAKAIIAAFYGNGPRLSYWNGCSTGGKQGLTEAQRYPDDYNAIAAGAPANYWTHLMFGTIWPAFADLQDPASHIPAGKYPLIHKAALDACDQLDGVKDGIIDDPRRCHFDPKTLECSGPDASTCLTAPQVEAARKIYAGATNPRTGKQVFPGLTPGSELGWGVEAGGPKPMSIPLTFFQFVLFKNPDWKWQTLDFNRDVALADQQVALILNAVDPDLRAFKAHGGKLLLYHGWIDNLITPLNTVNYYESMVRAMGGPEMTRDFARLFMIPGMGHCQGGPGTDIFDKVGVLEQWAEKGVAPAQITASHQANGVTDMTRPLCPYPQVARWKNSGSTTDAANFVCLDPAALPSK